MQIRYLKSIIPAADGPNRITALAWSPNNQKLAVAGADRVIQLFDETGERKDRFSTKPADPKSTKPYYICSLAFSPDSSKLAVAQSDCAVFVYKLGLEWGEKKSICNKLIQTSEITCLTWPKEQPNAVVFGMVDGKRSRYKGKFEFNYVSPSQVIVKRLSTGSRIVLKSHYGYEIEKVNIFQDQFLIANTPETLLMGDLASCKLSEIPWTGSGNEKFYFDNPSVCMVFNAGELSLIEYGVNEILGSCRTEHMNPHLISVRLNERKAEEDTKRIAYLIDLQTIHVLDLLSGLNLAVISHDSKIDWLELSGKANKLLFRDRRQQLHLYDLATQQRTTLLHFCTYVQWVPSSDVVVAQSRNNLCIWYSIDSPERVTMFQIKGDVEDIEREGGKTEVIVDEGVNTVSYTLDETLIEFGTALDDKDYERAVALLETLEMTSETEAMWQSLGKIALKDREILTAQRCCAALGDVAKARYLGNIFEMMDDPENDYKIKASLAVLDKQFKVAESIYLDQGKVEEAMEMYQELHKWNMSIKVAESKNHPDLENLRKNYFQWLVESGQEDKAGELKEEEGDVIAAINLFLKGGMPARAAGLLHQYGLNQVELTERVASSLFKSGLFEKAGELYEKLGSGDRALDAYKKGKAFRAAVELSRVMYPHEVVGLEEQWGDYLVSQKQMDAAINHYIEAGKSFKAIEAAIAAKQWKKAVGIVDSLQPPESGKPYFLQLAKHFASVSELALAEKYFVLGGRPQEAVDMYTKANKWEKAHSLATTYMSADEVAFLYISQAREMENDGKLKEAEKLYLTVGEPDLAINMYKNHKHYDHMIRLVTAYHKDLLTETHLYLAKTLESEGNFKQAENHYVEGKDWKAAINMYCANNSYEEAYRVAKTNGGPNSAKQVAYLWARSLGGESAVKLLTKFGLLEAAIDFATENGAFDFAFELSRFADKFKLSDIHYKHAMFLEDEGKFKEAENAFILAGKPKEAILMYIHNEDWDAAVTVADTYDPQSLGEVLISRAKACFDRKDFANMETLLLRAQRPDLVVKLYKDNSYWKEALQFAKEFLPHKLPEIHDEYNRYLSEKSGGGGREEILSTARLMEQQKDFSRAIDLYLKFTTQQTSDTDFLEEVWEKAVVLAMKFVPERGREVVSIVCSRLLAIQRYEQAAEFYAGVEMFREAIDAYAAGNMWEKAKEIVSIAPKLSEYLESTYVSHLKNQGQADALVNVDIVAGLDLFVQKGDWDKCLDTAASQASEIDKGKFETAAQYIAKYGVIFTPSSNEVYMRLSLAILKGSASGALAPLRDVLFKLAGGWPQAPPVGLPPDYSKFLLISHFLTLRNYCAKKRELTYFAARQSISLLRYVDILPVDKTFYEAGFHAKLGGMSNMAFVCWNRFLDISDAIEEGDNSLLENADFARTDVPYDIELPQQNFLPDDKRDEVRDWVLQVSLDQKIKQEVDQRECDVCSTAIYEASLSCYNCKTTNEPCIIT
ncbi:hypothetical protein HDU76_012895, partial [Blyttiomyces sp. JEL0837]